MTALSLAKAAVFFGLGLALGLAYFRGLRANVRLYLSGARAWRAAGLHALRLAGAGLAFWAASSWGATAVLAMLLGFMGARFFSLRGVGTPC